MVGFNPRRSNFQRGALVYALGHFFLLKWGASLQRKLGKRREAMAPTFTPAMRWHCFPGGRAVVQPEEKSCSFLRLPTAPLAQAVQKTCQGSVTLWASQPARSASGAGAQLSGTAK